MRPPWTLTTKLLATGISFLVLALLSIGLTLWVSWELEGGAAAVNEAGRLRMHTYRLALSMEQRNPQDMREIAARFDAIVVDEAHGLGVHGPGLVAQDGLAGLDVAARGGVPGHPERLDQCSLHGRHSRQQAAQGLAVRARGARRRS